jgi:hypothetical protein
MKMRATWTLIVSIGLTAPALGQVFSFDTVFYSDGPVPTGASNVVEFTTQVVLQEGTNNVASLGSVDGSVAILFSEPSGPGYDTSLVVQALDPLYGGGGQFEDLQNVSLTGGGSRITFVGQSGSGFGVFQYDVGQPSPEHRVIFEGDSLGGGPIDLNGGLLGGVAYQAISSGKALFAGASGPELVASGDGSTTPVIIVDSSQPNTDQLSLFTNTPGKYAYTSTGAAVFIADNNGSRDVVSVGTPLATPTVRFTGGQVVNSEPYEPEQLLGATDNDALFIGQDDDGNFGILISRQGDGTKALSTFASGDVGGPGDLRTDGVITEGRKVALFAPNGSGGSVKYYDSDADSAVQTVAAIGTHVTDDAIPLEIRDISLAEVFAPMVNDNGVIVFDARIAPESGPNSGDEVDALIAWWPALAHPVVVAKVGDVIDIGGNPETIAAILPNGINPIFDGGIYKDGLNNQNYLAFGVAYDDGNKSAVLLTQIPEPGIGLLALGFAVGGGMVNRRRRNKA